MTEKMVEAYALGALVMVGIIVWAGFFLWKRSGRDRYLRIILEAKNGSSFFLFLEKAACLSGPYQLDCPRLLKMAKKKQIGWKLVTAIVGRYLVETDKICTEWADRQKRYLAVAGSLLDFFGIASDKDMRFILSIPCVSDEGQFSRRSLLLAMQDLREIRQWQTQAESTRLIREQKEMALRKVFERGQALFNPAPQPHRGKVILPVAVAQEGR